MAELASVERVMLALNRQEPDRVPHFEWLVNPAVRQALVPGCKTHHEFAVKMLTGSKSTGNFIPRLNR
jgi:hypothetical protein